MASRVQKGSKSLWMNKRVCAVWYVGQNPSTSLYEDAQDFVHKLENPDKSKVSEDKTDILIAIEKMS